MPGINYQCVFTLIGVVFSVVLGDVYAFGQNYVRDKNTPIAQHHKRRTAYRLPQGLKTDPQFLAGLLFSKAPWELPSPEEERLISFTSLAACKKPEVKLRRVYHHTPFTDQFDVVYYSDKDPEQRRRAHAHPQRVVPYQAALVRDAKSKNADFWQVFARFTQIAYCQAALPWRYSM